MRKKIWLLLLCFILPACFSLSRAAEPAGSLQTIHWQPWSLSIFEEAKREHKLILIFGKVSWCHWCQKMEAYTFPDPAVVQLVNKGFVPVKVDIEQDVSVGRRYRITEIPSLIVLDDHNRELKRYYGYSSPQSVLRKLSGLAE